MVVVSNSGQVRERELGAGGDRTSPACLLVRSVDVSASGDTNLWRSRCTAPPTSPMSVMALPPELHKLVVDYLARDGDPSPSSTLKSCALVCKSWHTYALRHLFSTIMIPSTLFSSHEDQPLANFWLSYGDITSNAIDAYSQNWGGLSSLRFSLERKIGIYYSI